MGINGRRKMRTKKIRFMTLLLAVILTVSFTGCGKDTQEIKTQTEVKDEGFHRGGEIVGLCL